MNGGDVGMKCAECGVWLDSLIYYNLQHDRICSTCYWAEKPKP